MPVSSENNKGYKGLVTASMVMALGLIICALIVTYGFIKVKGFGRTITVTGAAYKPIISDYAVWEGTISVTAATMESASTKLQADRKKTEAFLQKEGLTEDEYEIRPVYIYKNYNREQTITGYSLNQTVKIEMGDVDRITRLAKKASSLIDDGVEFNSLPPQYLFTGLDSLKLEMIRAATENAKLRAEQLARTTGHEVGSPVSAQAGIFQIRPQHSQEVSGMGMSDVSSIEKEIVSTVHVSFLID
ncbi:MAG: SIMPL domain-containing protein [Candidatus Zixiibacteriota bacterium]